MKNPYTMTTVGLLLLVFILGAAPTRCVPVEPTEPDPNACEAAGGTCVGLHPESCPGGTWGDANIYPCGDGVGVGCCLPIPAEPEVSFVLANESERDVYIQHAVLPDPAWLTVAVNSDPVRIIWDCGMPCHCDPSESCMVCGMLPPHVSPLAPGESVALTWDGTRYVIYDQNGGVCYDTMAMPPGPMTAEFCYGLGFEAAEFSQEWQYITEKRCATLPFDYGADAEVRFVIED